MYRGGGKREKLEEGYEEEEWGMMLLLVKPKRERK